MKRHFSYCVAAVILSVMVLGASRAFAAGARCPSGGTPPPGATVIGGLEVDGVCVLNKVTIHGGVVVDLSAGLELENCIVFGGIVVNPGGELDVGHLLTSNADPTGNPNTINGGIVIDGAVDFDLDGVKINGGLTVTGSIKEFPSICGSTILGDVSFADVLVGGFITFADPEDSPFPTKPCLGNRITGSVTLNNALSNSTFDLEGNSIGGSVFLDASKLEFGGNKIAGSAVCSGGTVIVPPPGPDVFGNTVGGSNSCPD